MLRHLASLIPGQRSSELVRQAGDRAGGAVVDCLSAVPGQGRPVLHTSSHGVRHPRQVQQHREPRRALHQRADRATIQPQDEIPFPVARHRPVTHFCWPLRVDFEFWFVPFQMAIWWRGSAFEQQKMVKRGTTRSA
jgi:hypothetical protein